MIDVMTCVGGERVLVETPQDTQDVMMPCVYNNGQGWIFCDKGSWLHHIPGIWDLKRIIMILK